RLALDARLDAGNEPARQAHFDYRDQCVVLFQDDTGSVQVVRRVHWGGSIGTYQRRWIQFPRRHPIASFPGAALTCRGDPCGRPLPDAASRGDHKGRPYNGPQVLRRRGLRRNAAYFSWSATLSMAALAQASSLSPPGAPDTPIAPMVSSPTLIGSAPWAGTMLVRRSAPGVRLSLSDAANSPDGRRWAFAV